MLPPVFLDYKSMVAHDFIVKNRENELKYKLFFDKHHPETITLPAPSLFDLSAGKYLVPLEAIHACRNPTSATEPESEPQVDPPRQSNYKWDPEMIANQWQSESSSSQYDPNYYFGYPPGQPWPWTNLGQKPKLGGVRISHRHYIHVHTLISRCRAHTFSL